MNKARNSAVSVLLKCELDNSYSNIAVSEELKKCEFEDYRDSALFTNIVYGVTENKILIDYNLSLYLKSPLKKLSPVVAAILRTGAYQILFSDKIPVSAAVNESVDIAVRRKQTYAKGLINAVLRKVADNGLIFPEKKDTAEYFSVKYSFPKDMADFFTDIFGYEKTEDIFEAFQGKRPVFIRVNTLKTNDNELIGLLEKDGFFVNKTSLENCLEIAGSVDMTLSSSYKNGYFHVQDMSSQYCCMLAGVKPGETVVDCCAAPGGKSFTLSQYMENSGLLVSNDMYEARTELIRKGAERLGISCLKTAVGDARELPQKISAADAVLCDVPCSGLGVIGRKPEIKYKNPKEFAGLPIIQKGILSECSRMVKPGGKLVYSTCTLNPAENENVCNAFLDLNPDFFVSNENEYRKLCSDEKYITFLPQKEKGDGFFVAVFERNNNEN